MKPFYCRIGSKRSLIKKILPLIPEHSVYVEPFIGGGAIYFAKEPSEYEIINDLDSELITNYKLLQKIKGRDFPTNLNTIPKLTKYYFGNANKQTDKLTKSIIKICNGFAGRQVSNKIYHSPNPYSKLKLIDEYQERMSNTKILNQSYEKLFKYDSPETFFYLDPPYESSEGLYKDPIIDYEEMRSLLDKIKGKFLLSINDSPYIRSVFKGYKIKGFTLKGVGGMSIGENPRKELFIRNY